MEAAVRVRACPDYDRETVRSALRNLLDAGGGLDSLYPKSGRILVKPNLVRGGSPGGAVATHPVVITEAVRLLRESGRPVLVGDSPGIGSARSHLRRLGCLEELERLGAEVRGLRGPVASRLPSGRTVGLSRDALEAAGILSLPKWKTHVQVGMTGAVKNLFGCLVGPRKALQHVGYGHRYGEFQRTLLGIAELLKPAYQIVDGVLCMEGDGPLHGTPKQVGYLLAGTDPVALDRILADRMGLGDLKLFRAAREMGFGEADLGSIPLWGDFLPERIEPPFLLPRPAPLTFHPIRRLLARIGGAPAPW